MAKKNTKHLKIGHLNVRSLLPSLADVRDCIAELDLDVLAISESWLMESIPDERVRIPGFNFFRVDRAGRGGGVGVYLRGDLIVNQIDVGEKNEVIEQVWLTLKFSRMVLGLGIFYRPPRFNALSALSILENSLASIMPLCDEVILLGDININLLEHSRVNEHFENFLDTFNFKQLVLNPTRFVLSKASLIDVIMISNDNLLCGRVRHHDLQQVSDHQLIYCSLDIEVPDVKPEFVEFRDFKNFNKTNFDTDLYNVNWGTIFDQENLDDKVRTFTSLVLGLFDTHAPRRTVRVTKPRAPWFTDVLQIMKRHRNVLFSKFKKTRRVHDWEAYKRARNMFTQAVRSEKRAYLDFASRNQNSKSMWQTLHNMNVYNKKKNHFTTPSHLQDPDEINSFFVDSVLQICPDVNPDTICYYSDNKVTDSMFEVSLVSDGDVISAISDARSNASGADQLTLQMLRLCCPLIVPFLTHIFNISILESKFPSDWKLALVLPLPKVSSPKDYSELRPISLLSILSKILEKIIFKQIVNYFNNNNLFFEGQSGFRRGFGTATALLSILDDIFGATDRGETTALVLLDYSKAFDTLDPRLLCAKLHYYGFKERTINLLKDYLADRSQRVLINRRVSQSLALDRGVPQGSILGPLLFVIYTMDMHCYVNNCRLMQYADDSQILRSFNRPNALRAEQEINHCLNSILTYSNNNGLRINPRKSAVLYFGTNSEWASENLNLNMAQERIPFVTEYKNLGILFDSKLRFRKQVSLVAQRAYCSLRNLYKNRHILNLSLKKYLCETLVLSHSNYCNFVYGPCLDLMSKYKLQKIQNSCVRFIFGCKGRDHVSGRLKELKWLRIKDRERLHLGCFLHRLLRTGVPQYLYGRLHHRGSVHQRNTRYNDRFQIPMHRTSVFKQSFGYTSAKLLNEIPEGLLALSELSFRRQLKEILFQTS